VRSAETRDGVEVVVDEDGQLARWADWQAHAKGMPLVAIAAEGDPPMMFVANEVLVDAEARDVLSQLADDGGTIVEDPPLQRAPDEIHQRELTGEFPMPVLVRFDEPPQMDAPERVLSSLFEHSEERAGRVTVTSEAGARLAVDVGSFLEGPTGLVRESGQHAFFEYFELGDTAELQPLCDALD
jgi:hypothetical protein